MWIAVRFMMDEAEPALAEAIGPFPTDEAAYAFINQHWPDTGDNDTDVFELTSPAGGTTQGV